MASGRLLHRKYSRDHIRGRISLLRSKEKEKILHQALKSEIDVESAFRTAPPQINEQAPQKDLWPSRCQLQTAPRR